MTGPGPAKPGATPQARSTPGPSTPDEIDLSGPSPWATGALLGLIEQAAQGVLVLCEGLTRDELLGSRLTRTEVLRQLSTLTLSATQLDAAVQAAMPELDWAGWAALAPRLRAPAGPALDEALWFAVESLVPATLLWLRFYRQQQPRWFRIGL